MNVHGVEKLHALSILRRKIMSENGNNATTLAAQWRKLSRRFADRVELTLPSGMVIKVQRPNVGAWIRSGRVPQTVTTAMLKAAKGGQNPTALLSQLDEKQFFDVMVFMRDMVMETVIEPRIVLEADPNNPDEIGAGEISDEDFNFIAAWAMEGTVQMRGGEDATVGQLANFRGDASLSSAGEDSGAVRSEAQPTSGN